MLFRPFVRLGAATALAAGLTFAQGPGANPNPAPQQGGRGAGIGPLIAAALNLTDAQKTQTKAIFQDARDQAKPIAQQLRDQRAGVRDAIKNPNADVDTLTKNQASLMAQLMAIRLKAFQKFYALLTPEQQQKLDQFWQQRGRWGRFGGMRFGGPMM